MQTPDMNPTPASSEELDYLLSHYDAGARLLAEANGMLDSIQAALALAEAQQQPVDMALLSACSGLHHVLSQVRSHYQGLFELAKKDE